MFCNAGSNLEDFQDLGLWCSASPSVDNTLTENSKVTEEAINWTPPQSVDSSVGIGSCPPTPWEALSPDVSYSNYNTQHEPELLDIASLPVMLAEPSAEQPVSYFDANYTASQDSLMQMVTLSQPWDHLESFTPADSNEMLISEYILGEAEEMTKIKPDVLVPYKSNCKTKSRSRLRLDVAGAAPVDDVAIATPDVLNFVDEMEAKKLYLLDIPPVFTLSSEVLPSPHTIDSMHRNQSSMDSVSHKFKEEAEDSDEDRYQYRPAAKRRRRTSEDSDASYNPYKETSLTPKRKRSTVTPLVAQELKTVRRGRPPKRRESLASASTTDDASSIMSLEEMRYRDIRDKNNEASKRSRESRKQKEAQMVRLGDELEEKNKRLRVKAQVLEELTKKLKEALLSKILGK